MTERTMPPFEEVEIEDRPFPDEQDLPVIRLGNLADNATAGERALIESGAEVYQNGGKLVRPVIEKTAASDKRKTTVVRLAEINATYLRDLLMRYARWESYDVRSKTMVRRDPPRDIAHTILARVGEWGFPIISGVIATPTMRPDGSLLEHPGYDPATGLLLIDPPPMSYIPARPSRAEAMHALEFLEDLLSEFPFADDLSKSVALSALITPVVRGAFTVAPLHAFSATSAGSGKSYLADIVSLIATGRHMPVMTPGKSEEEMEKRLGAALMAGQALISLDNVTVPLGGQALCTSVERPSLRIRILGQSQQASVEARGTTFFATGNNLTVYGDMCRRVIKVMIDPKVEQPECRQFKSDPIAKVLAHRGQYVAAGLTICRAYAAAGRPSLAPKLGSFEGWSDTVRSALIWLGQNDPVGTIEKQRRDDPKLLELASMLSTWADAIGIGDETTGCTTKEVFALAKQHPELAEAIDAVGRKGKADALTLGYWLRANKGRVVNGLRFEGRSSRKGVLWWIEQIEYEGA